MTQRTETVHESARRTRVDIVTGDETRRGVAATELHDEDDFRRHYQSMYGIQVDFENRSAYHDADDPETMQLRGRHWSEVEEDLHRSWGVKHPEPNSY